MQKENNHYQRVQTLTELLPAWQAEAVMQLLDAFEKSEQRNAELTEVLSWVASSDRWTRHQDNLWEWRDRSQDDFRQVLNAVMTGAQHSGNISLTGIQSRADPGVSPLVDGGDHAGVGLA